MTEDEAKTKWCPFARVREPGFAGYGNAIIGTSVNRIPEEGQKNLNDVVHCIGSACMAWRGKDEYGHCGLAGWT